jgi:hypothetical protein
MAKIAFPQWITLFSDSLLEKTLNKLVTFMVRQVHHERNQHITVRPEFVEGLNQASVESAPWFHVLNGERINHHHLSLAEKNTAREIKKKENRHD